jgi:hypothetical protein
LTSAASAKTACRSNNLFTSLDPVQVLQREPVDVLESDGALA